MFNKSVPPDYMEFEDAEVWRICCENWGDYNETVITDNGDNTVNIVESFIRKKNTLEVKRIVLNTQVNVDNTGGTYTPGTTKEAVGITLKQCAAVTSLQQKFKNNNSIGKFHEFRYFTSVTYFSSGGDLSYSSLTEITFPSSMTQTYGSYALYSCPSLTVINMNEGLEKINSSYFIYSDSSLKTLTIPSTVTEIAQNALAVSSGSKKCTFILLPTTPPDFRGNITYSTSIAAVYVPDESVTAYKEAQYWSAIADRIYPISEYVES